jgi:pterin-4a-carbinolamine dehydratase
LFAILKLTPSILDVVYLQELNMETYTGEEISVFGSSKPFCSRKLKPREPGAFCATAGEVAIAKALIPGWLMKNAELSRSFEFSNLSSASVFCTKIFKLAKRVNFDFGSVCITPQIFKYIVYVKANNYILHVITENDFIFASKVDKIFEQFHKGCH